MDLIEAIEHMGLPKGTILREDDLTYDLWCDKTDLKADGERSCYPAEIRNHGSMVTVWVGGKRVSKLQDTALPIAVKALKAYGGKSAPAVIKLTREGSKTDSVLVPKR
jgi:hypothetical protein